MAALSIELLVAREVLISIMTGESFIVDHYLFSLIGLYGQVLPNVGVDERVADEIGATGRRSDLPLRSQATEKAEIDQFI